MSQPSISRRRLFGAAVLGTGLLLGLGGATSAAAPACFDLNALSTSDRGMRDSLGFKPQSPDPKKRCGLCSFFTAGSGECGACALLNGGPVAATSVCDSWAAKA